MALLKICISVIFCRPMTNSSRYIANHASRAASRQLLPPVFSERAAELHCRKDRTHIQTWATPSRCTQARKGSEVSGQLCCSHEALLCNHHHKEALLIWAKRNAFSSAADQANSAELKRATRLQLQSSRGAFQMLWSNEGQKEQVFLQSHFYLLQQTLIQYEGRLWGSNLVGRQLARPPGTREQEQPPARGQTLSRTQGGVCLGFVFFFIASMDGTRLTNGNSEVYTGT